MGRHEWFWEPGDDAHVFPLEHLMKMYYGSVGRNSTLILGVTPDDRGLLPDVDVARLKEFGDEIQRRFGNPIATTQGEGKRLQLKLPQRQRSMQLSLQKTSAKANVSVVIRWKGK